MNNIYIYKSHKDKVLAERLLKLPKTEFSFLTIPMPTLVKAYSLKERKKLKYLPKFTKFFQSSHLNREYDQLESFCSH